jgi:DNA-binding MarR family transcriptional regulator
MSASEEKRLFWLLSLAYRRAASMADDGLAGSGLTAAQAGALFAIPMEGAATVNDVAGTLRIAQSAASSFAQRLEKAGLVCRKADPKDSRYALLTLTERGRELRSRALLQAKSFNGHLSQGFSEDELATVSRWLRHVINMKEEVEDND